MVNDFIKVEAKKRKNVASLSSNSNISPNSSVPVNENKSQNEIPTDSTQPHIFDTPRGRSRIKEKPQNKESKSNPPEIAPLDNSSQNSEAANAVLPEKRKRGRPAKSVSVEKPKNKQSEPRRRSSRVEARDKVL